jgi:hypothetical protein
MCIQDAWESPSVHFEVTTIRFDSLHAKITGECIGVHINTCVRKWMLGVRLCVQDAWETSFFHSEVTAECVHVRPGRVGKYVCLYLKHLCVKADTGYVCVHPGHARKYVFPYLKHLCAKVGTEYMCVCP